MGASALPTSKLAGSGRRWQRWVSGDRCRYVMPDARRPPAKLALRIRSPTGDDARVVERAGCDATDLHKDGYAEVVIRGRHGLGEVWQCR